MREGVLGVSCDRLLENIASGEGVGDAELGEALGVELRGVWIRRERGADPRRIGSGNSANAKLRAKFRAGFRDEFEEFAVEGGMIRRSSPRMSGDSTIQLSSSDSSVPLGGEMQESLTDNATWYAFCTRAARRKSTTDGGDQSTKVFTIAHELAHVWIGQNALASADELETGHGRIESFCNGVAAEVLVLKQEFLNAWLHDSGSAHTRVTMLLGSSG